MSSARLLDTSELADVYLVQGRNRTLMRMAPAARYLLESGRAGRPAPELAAGLARLTSRPVSPAEAEAAYRLVDERVRAIESKPPPAPAGFWVRLSLIPGAMVERIARPLALLFQPTLALPLIAGGGVAVLASVLSGRSLQPGGDYLAAYGLFLLSLVAHEFGHAAACARYGGRPSAIGFALYLVYPVLYSDVGAAWALRRWQRVVVDLGGVYFQALVGAGYLAAYAATGWRPLTLGVLLIAASCLFSLNPFFKFDGYWVLSDALGVVGLGRQRARLFEHFRARLRGRAARPLPWPPAVSAFVAAYSAATAAVWAVFLMLVVPFLGSRVLGFPAQLAADLPRLVAGGGLPPAAVQSLLLAALAVVTLGTMLVRLLARLGHRRPT
jgi:putative peptide zinc metalloprotease protein